MKQQGWPQNVVDVIAAEVRRHRTRLKMSAQRLSDRCEELGYPVARNTISNLENGRKETLTVTELAVIAAALRVPLLLLMYPVGQVGRVEALPGVEMEPLHGLLWASGLFEQYAGEDWPRPPSGVPDVDEESVQVITLYRAHESAVRGWQDVRRIARPGAPALVTSAGVVASFRSAIAAHGRPLPELPADLAAELASPASLAAARSAAAALTDGIRQTFGGE
ncbi:MAG: helix-turn-helix transcriptional regulator [Pseudonocardia sp.]|nr:helix-turn-helix transcriptional regulator [Pseudonocardia sp.]